MTNLAHSELINNAPTLKQKLAIGSGFFSLFFLDKGCELLAIPFYQMTLAVDPFLFSLALTIPIVFSAFLSPWVGQFSDLCQSKLGRRRPFLIIFSWLSALFFGLIWMVPQSWSTNWQLLYFFITTLLFYAVSSFYSIPLTSLSYEITQDVNERVKIMAVNSYFSKVASFLSQWLYPLATLTVFGSVFVGIKVVGWGLAIVVFGIAGSLPAFFIKESGAEQKPREDKKSALVNVKEVLSVPLMKLVAVTMFIQLGCAAYAAKMDYYVLVYYVSGSDIGQGAVWKAVLTMGYAVVATIHIPIVASLSRYLGNINALKVVFALALVGGIVKWFVFVPEAGWLILLDPILCAAIWTAMTIIIPALIAQASNQDSEKSQQRREGSFAATHTWIAAVSVMFALMLGGLTLKMIGFDANLTGQQSEATLQWMRVILSVGTVAASAIALALISIYQKRHLAA
ncbi:MFS transporter [Aliiglaciecola sp. NS0011-25]|uniref:MFS transporter n=1 Tax=Aliiglaciecola sp. NS0011-25 TaxID=3127654 RepID=UPI003106F33E